MKTYIIREIREYTVTAKSARDALENYVVMAVNGCKVVGCEVYDYDREYLGSTDKELNGR